MVYSHVKTQDPFLVPIPANRLFFLYCLGAINIKFVNIITVNLDSNIFWEIKGEVISINATYHYS